MVFFDMRETGVEPEKTVEYFFIKGIKINYPEEGIMRFVTNYWVDRENVQYVVEVMRELAAK